MTKTFTKSVLKWKWSPNRLSISIRAKSAKSQRESVGIIYSIMADKWVMNERVMRAKTICVTDYWLQDNGVLLVGKFRGSLTDMNVEKLFVELIFIYLSESQFWTICFVLSAGLERVVFTIHLLRFWRSANGWGVEKIRHDVEHSWETTKFISLAYFRVYLFRCFTHSWNLKKVEI